jgi:hypothetical protein
MESSTIDPPKHRMRITDQIHLNPAYLDDGGNDKQQTEELWIERTKL